MSKIGKKPIIVPKDVEVKVGDNALQVKGREGSLDLPILPHTKVEFKDEQLVVSMTGNDKQARANWGTMRSLAQNAVSGVNSGFIKELEIQGVGFKAVLGSGVLVLHVGFSHPVQFIIPEGIKIAVEKSFIKISGFNKHLVGQVAAQIRAIKKPEPYLGKGIRYRGEAVVRKEGKRAAGATGTAAAA